MTFDYFNRYENVAMERTDSGILTVRLHTDGGPIVFTGQAHRDLARAFAEIGDDRDNKVVILTGSGDVFMDEIDGASLGEIFKPGEWDKIYWEGRRVLQRLLEIEAPIVAAVNGPATVHSEYVLLADITVASEDAVFADKPHLGFGIVPGDGIHVIYEELLGERRRRSRGGRSGILQFLARTLRSVDPSLTTMISSISGEAWSPRMTSASVPSSL